MTIDLQSYYDIDPDDLDTEQVDYLTSHLQEVKEESIEDIDLLRHLFSITRSVMQFKSVQLTQSKPMNPSSIDDNMSKQDLSEQLQQSLNSLEEKETLVQELEIELKQLRKSLEITIQEKEMINSELESARREFDRKEESDDFYSENRSHLEKIREKNAQITGLLDELKKLEEENASLSVKVTRLSSSLNRATYEMELSADEMAKLREEHKLTIEMNKSLLKEKESLLGRLKSLKDKVEYYEEEDLSNKLTTRIDQVIEMIEERDSEIYRLKKELSNLKVTPADESTRPSRVMDMTPSKLAINPMAQGNVLRSYLEDAARVMDEQNDLIESLKDQICRSRSESTNNLTEINKSTVRSSESSQNDQDQVLELELSAKDSEIIELRKQLFIYENQNFGLKEATSELKKCKERENNLQDKLEDMTNQLNQLHMQLTDAEDELDYIRECAKMKGIENDYIPRNRDTRKDKLEILNLQQQLVQLEEDKIDLQEKVRSLSRVNAYQRADDQMNGEVVNEENEQIRELKEENEALELGMKEILLALQRTDCKSDAVVDCPTLERLCQVLESRSVSPSLAPVIALKAELDLVRGNNEQLRAELKRIRQEHLSLLAIYTEEILASTELDRSCASQVPIPDEQIRDTNEPDDESNDQSHNQSRAVHQQSQSTVSRVDEVDDDETSQSEEPHTRQPVDEDSIRTASDESSDEMTVDDENETQVVVEENITDDEMTIADQSFNRTRNEIQRTRSFTELLDAQVQVDLKPLRVEGSTCDMSTMTEMMADSQVKSTESSPKCNKCIILSATMRDLMNRLKTLEDQIKSSDDETKRQVSRLQSNHTHESDQLREQLQRLHDLIAEKENIIDHMKKQMIESVPKASTTNRRETHVISRSDFESSSSPGLIALPNVPSTALVASTNAPSSLTNIVEGVIECLESRIEHKESFIKQYEERIRQAKDSFESELTSVLSKLQVDQTNEIHSFDPLKVMMENENLKSRLKFVTTCLDESKEENDKRIKQLEEQLEEEKVKLNETQLSLESAKKRSSFNQIVSLRNEVNQYQEELKAKETLIESLHKRLQEERRLRLANTRVKVKEASSSNEVSASTMNSFVDHLKSQLEAKEKQLKQIELAKWTSEKKYQEKIQLVERKLDQEKKETEKLHETVKRLKLILERKKITPVQEKTTGKTVDTTSDKDKVTDRENELKTLLQESYKREKVAALRLISVNAPQVNLEENLLVENAQLKVDLRMAEYKLTQEARVK